MKRRKINSKKHRAALEIITKNDRETKKLGEFLAQEIISSPYPTVSRRVYEGWEKNEQAQLFSGGFNKNTVVIISLEGDLGSGKTTFAKGFAKGLGIRETIQSPTFVIAKIYNAISPYRHSAVAPLLRRPDDQALKRSRATVFWHYVTFVHIDAYRITPKDLPAIGWDEFIRNPHVIILVEWGDRVRAALPKNHIKVLFQHRASQKRFIRFSFLKQKQRRIEGNGKRKNQ